MNRYEITNTTHLLGKRDMNYNSILNIEYVDEMVKKSIELKPKEVLYLTARSLPVSLIKYRIKGLISVVEISSKELKSKIKQDKATKNKGTEKEKEVKKTTTTTTTTKKQTTKSTSKKKSSSQTKSNTKNPTEKTMDIVKDNE